jgi:DNA-binding transcriptional LysR family regulator
MVSKHIGAIEERLGVLLFHRSTRRLTLTEAGRSYLRSCFRILAEIEDAEELATAGQFEPRGYLRLNAPVSFGTMHIAPLLAEFASLYPKVTVELDLNDGAADLVPDGWDMAIRIGDLPNSSLRARRLAPCQLVVCAAPAYLEKNGQPKTVSELAQHNCLAFTMLRRKCVDHWSFGDDHETRIPISGNLYANNMNALRAAALAGLGIACLPTFMAGGDLRTGQLVALDLDQIPAPAGDIWAVFPADRRMPLKTRKMIDFLADSFGRTPPWEREMLQAAE